MTLASSATSYNLLTDESSVSRPSGIRASNLLLSCERIPAAVSPGLIFVTGARVLTYKDTGLSGKPDSESGVEPSYVILYSSFAALSVVSPVIIPRISCLRFIGSDV